MYHLEDIDQAINLGKDNGSDTVLQHSLKCLGLMSNMGGAQNSQVLYQIRGDYRRRDYMPKSMRAHSKMKLWR